MTYHPSKTQTWDRSTPADGDDFDDEFDQLYENDSEALRYGHISETRSFILSTSNSVAAVADRASLDITSTKTTGTVRERAAIYCTNNNGSALIVEGGAQVVDSGTALYSESTGDGHGIVAKSSYSEDYGVYGLNTSGTGVVGRATTGAHVIPADGTGVYGEGEGCGVQARAYSGKGIDSYGTSYGGYFISDQPGGVGIRAESTHPTLSGNAGDFVSSHGYGISATGSSIGVHCTGNTGIYANGTAFGGNLSASAGEGIRATGTNFGGKFIASSGVGAYGTGSTDGVQGVGATGVHGISGTGFGVLGEGTTFDFYAAGTGVNYGPFTGAHQFTIDNTINPLPGMILSVEYVRIRNDLIDGNSVQNISTTFPHLKIAEPGETAYCIFNQAAPTTGSDPVIFWEWDENHLKGSGNALGEGWLLATDRAGVPIKNDLLVISSIPGYAEVLPASTPMTVGTMSSILCKVIDNIDFTDAELIEGTSYRRKLVPVVYMMG